MQFKQGHWPRRNDFSRIIDHAETISAGVIGPAEIHMTPLKFPIAVFIPWIRALGGVDEKKPRIKNLVQLSL
jgi:hypothetical protein